MITHDQAPNGHFAADLILFGNLERGGLASKGFILEPPDLHNASIAAANEFHDKTRLFLATLGAKQRAQIQWTCNADYRAELLRYRDETVTVPDPVVRAYRLRRFDACWNRMNARQLRRELLVLFVSQEIDGSANASRDGSVYEHYCRTLQQLVTDFQECEATLRTVFGSDTNLTPMSDLDHFAYFKRFLNPSLTHQFDLDLETLFDPSLAIQELCWDGDGVALNADTNFYLDGKLHCIFALKRWPQKTHPGIIHRLTSLPFLDYQITVNLTPVPVRDEIAKEERAMDRLRGDYAEEGKHSIAVALHKKERKIESLAQGSCYPFDVQFLIRVWDDTEPGLHAKTAAIRNAVHHMNGAQTYETALPATAKKLFFATWPGWTGSSYRHRNLYAEDRYLADLLPLSSTFTAHLAEAEALYDGTNGNLVGVRSFVGGSPQHAVLIGMTGAGKSYFLNDLLTQNQHRFDYTLIVEEGLSYKHYTESLGERPILIHPDGELTINYLDTQGLPLSQIHLASAVTLLTRMIGECNPEKQQLRQAQLAQYLNQLYDDTFEDWSRKHPDQVESVQRLALAIHRWRIERLPLGSTLLEAYAELRDRLRASDDEAQTFVAKLDPSDIAAFVSDPQTRHKVVRLAFSFLKPHEYPTHSALLDLLFYARFPEHNKDEIDQMATLLSAWTATGPYGRLFDGETNISLTGRIAHFELGYIPEQAVELKTAAGLLISGFTRQHIITLPRPSWKRIVFEEVARFLDVPGGEKIVAESYAQLRKFNCWTISIVQQYSKFKTSRIRPVVIGNSKQFFLMRQLDRTDLEDLATDIRLPEVTVEAIQSYPLPEQQLPERRFSSVCYFAPSAAPPICGTLRHIAPQPQPEFVH